MKKIDNSVMLITYADSISRDIPDLSRVLETYFPGAFGGVHILPFFPSSGDHGFAVITYDTPDPTFGTWEDVDRLGEQYYLMADFMLNHVSIRCPEFRDYMEKGEASPYRDMFIHWNEFWPNGEPTEEELRALYVRKDRGSFKDFTRADGETVRLWNTFFEEQVDIDPNTAPTKEYYDRNLKLLCSHVPLIRFDAFAYASKRPGSSCFFVEPEIWDVLRIGMKPLLESGTEMLPEIHENYKIQLKMAERGYWVYDFALPLILIHGLLAGRTDRLLHWLRICPRKQFTTLDTHDGIGVVDAAGLLTEEEIDLVQEHVDVITEPAKQYIHFPSTIKKEGGKVKRYQLGCTYYDAVDSDDRKYLLARTAQFFTPGIPQVYYVGALAGRNDIEALKNGQTPRDINRHYYSEEELAEETKRPVVQELLKLMRIRNTVKAFNGTMTASAEAPEEGAETHEITVCWTHEDSSITLWADFRTLEFTITLQDPDHPEGAVIYHQEGK